MGDDKKEKNFKAALKSVVAPLLIVIRREVKEGNKKLLEYFEKRPDVQKTEVTNQQKDIEVSNFPEKIKAEITNPQKEVEVKGLTKSLSTNVKSIVNKLSTTADSIVKSLTESTDEVKTFIKSHTFKVEVENQKEIKFPKMQGVKLSADDMKILIKGIKQEVQRVQIENSTPGEAIPVVLTNKEKRRFYDLTLQITGGTNMARVVEAINNISVDISPGDIQIGSVEIKDDDTDTRLSVENDGGKNAAFVQSNSMSLEATQILIKDLLTALSKAEDSVHVSGDKGIMSLGVRSDTETALAPVGEYHPLLFSNVGRVKVDVSPNPRPGLRIAEFLKESGGSSDMNVDGSVTPVTFSAAPPTGKKWFIHSVTLIIEDSSINFKKFGGIAGGLTNGIEFRVKEGGLAEVTLGTFKTNGDFHLFTTDIRLDSASTDFLTVNVNMRENAGTTLELSAANSEIFKLITNDNLISVDRFNVLIKGFEVDE